MRGVVTILLALELSKSIYLANPNLAVIKECSAAALKGGGGQKSKDQCRKDWFFINTTILTHRTEDIPTKQRVFLITLEADM